MARELALRSRPRRRGRGPVGTLVLTAFVFLLAFVGFAAWALLHARSSDIAAGKKVTVVIPQGSRTRDVALLLESKGVIGNANMFRLRARLDELDGKMRPGTYRLRTRMSYTDALDTLAAGPDIAYYTVVVPEGFTIAQTAARFERDAHIPAAKFVAAANDASRFADRYPFLKGAKSGTLEGYLFPKTYRIQKGATADDAIETMLSQFAEEVSSVDLSFAKTKNLDLNDIVIIGSLVEREAKLERDRPLIASVVYNRLHRRMRLEIDATVQYALGRQHKRLLYSNLRVDSPYNTYLHAGLPPGPIASPGLASLKAAAHPADTKYLYYVLTGKDGSHTFAEDKAEFLRAKARAKEGLK